MCLIEDQSWIDCIDITSRWDAFVSFHLYGNKGVSLPLWPIRPRWFHTYRPCAEPLGDGHEGMWARFGSQGSIALNWHSRYNGTRYSGTWLYLLQDVIFNFTSILLWISLSLLSWCQQCLFLFVCFWMWVSGFLFVCLFLMWMSVPLSFFPWCFYRADPRFAPSQWDTALLCNNISHWLGASLESALFYIFSLHIPK